MLQEVTICSLTPAKSQVLRGRGQSVHLSPNSCCQNEKQSLEVSISPDPATGLVEEFPFRLARRFLRTPLSLF